MKELFKKEVMEKDVLNRILWDKKNFLSGNFCVQSEPEGSDSDKKLNPEDFDIHYFDRITKKLERAKFTEIKLKGDFFQFGEGLIPMHRIRKITCRGEVVWSRDRDAL